MGIVQLSETKLKGLWYFDENSLPRPNIVNPYNLEPQFIGHPSDAPVWDSTLSRWRIHDGRKIVLMMGNFLDFKPSDLVRTISIAIDFRLMTPLSGSIASSTTWTQIATLSSDIEIAIMVRFNSPNYEITLAYRNSSD